MSLFRDTDAAAEFIATADSRNTSPEVMEAIAFYARDETETVAIWEGWLPKLCVSMIILRATDNGRLHSASLHWGDRTLDQIMSDEERA